MKAIRIALGRPIAPFGEDPGRLPVLGIPLESAQNNALALCDLQLVQETDGPALVFGDHTWFTPELIRAFLNACPQSGGRLVLRGPFVEFTRSLQELADGESVGLPIYLSPAGNVSLDFLKQLAPVEVDLEVRVHQSPAGHVAFKGVADQPIPVTDKMVHTIEHWTHLHRINLLALMAYAERERRQFERAWWWTKIWRMLGVLLKSRSLNGARLAAALTQRGVGCNIHPTATVEASVLGDGVEIGPYAVVRGSFLASGSQIQEHAQVHLSVVGSGAVVGRTAMARMSVLMAGAQVSKCNGIQASVVGRDAFVAVGATLYDLSFGGPIRVMHRGERVSSGTRFLGSCLGHRSKIGPHVRIGYGETIPNDCFIVADPRTLVRDVGEVQSGEPHVLRDGSLSLIRKDP